MEEFKTTISNYSRFEELNSFKHYWNFGGIELSTFKIKIYSIYIIL